MRLFWINQFDSQSHRNSPHDVNNKNESTGWKMLMDPNLNFHQAHLIKGAQMAQHVISTKPFHLEMPSKGTTNNV